MIGKFKALGGKDEFCSAELRSELFDDDRVKLIRSNGHTLREKWKKAFLKNVNRLELSNIHLDQFLWHAISNKKIHASEGDTARDKLNNRIEDGCIFFFQDYDLVYKVVKSQKATDQFFEKYDDIYVVDKDFTWCYIHTHEYYCGPYYLSIGERNEDCY